jgi:hypothetical protein
MLRLICRGYGTLFHTCMTTMYSVKALKGRACCFVQGGRKIPVSLALIAGTRNFVRHNGVDCNIYIYSLLSFDEYESSQALADVISKKQGLIFNWFLPQPISISTSRTYRCV